MIITFTQSGGKNVFNIFFCFLANHFNLFPLSIGKLISQHQIQELHFSLTKGLWKHSRWGYPLRDASPGAELYAWFNPFHSK